ncbi:esterase-like activity of phytase family protein [Brucella anthropi]|uniref:esterase-like activity of phytase family protein n=1 Tax=Brucella anthropi TaxID=529 RepID=UPI00244A6AC2|nr:esterase-like activity of phytase family protein [Brucella anthropi]MDG9790214.1 esterase-like activity of phytase family protein [Brucella anthropi]MDH0579990.1 esterase-like activity of phytase family protein [Brucella anthropi]MDH0816614.1 esterase-like activity of phytase family protein [Brucella anthropi]MDH2083762.1 esterase-like activity of phytase family protein [Brucella anthropi]
MKAPFVALFLALATSAAAQEMQKPELIGAITLPTGLKIGGIEFGGISGLDYDPREDVYYAISDDRSENAPARFYKLKLAIDGSVQSLDVLETVTLLDKAGKSFALKDVDPESIRFNTATGTIYWSSEGDKNGRPFIGEAKTDGSFIREFALPEAYIPDEGKTRGVRNNLSFESLTITPDGKTLLAGTENALTQDGDKATLDHGSRSRIIAFDLASGNVTAEYAYDTDPIFTKATLPPFWNDNGLSEFVSDGNDLLTVERSFAMGVGNRITLYRASFDGASNVKDVPSLANQSVTSLGKKLFLQLNEGDFGLDIDNIEAITFGPMIDGKRTLILASDNNFNHGQVSQFIALKLP